MRNRSDPVFPLPCKQFLSLAGDPPGSDLFLIDRLQLFKVIVFFRPATIVIFFSLSLAVFLEAFASTHIDGINKLTISKPTKNILTNFFNLISPPVQSILSSESLYQSISVFIGYLSNTSSYSSSVISHPSKAPLLTA